jgi:hypothetical protein
MKDKKFTKTATFLFPLLNIPKHTFSCNIKNSYNKVIYKSRFINAYLHDDKLSHRDDDHVYLLLENYQDPDFVNFYSKLTSFSNYIDDYESNGYLVAIYNVPEKNKKDYWLILEGKYSKIQDSSKELIINNYYYHGAKMTLQLVLSKSDILKATWEEKLSFISSNINSPADLKDQEVWSKIIYGEQILTNETFTELKVLKKLKTSHEFDKL